jgi:hypothetical protein
MILRELRRAAAASARIISPRRAKRFLIPADRKSGLNQSRRKARRDGATKIPIPFAAIVNERWIVALKLLIGQYPFYSSISLSKPVPASLEDASDISSQILRASALQALGGVVRLANVP